MTRVHVCVCVCVKTAHLDADTHALGAHQLQQSHSIPHLKALPAAEGDEDTRANLSELLARLISSRKGGRPFVRKCLSLQTLEGPNGWRSSCGLWKKNKKTTIIFTRKIHLQRQKALYGSVLCWLLASVQSQLCKNELAALKKLLWSEKGTF